MTSEIESYRRAAKALKKAFRTGDANAIARVGDVIDKPEIRHADILHVVAKEAGHESWPKLKHAVELAAMSRDERAERLKYALYRGWNWMVDQLLAQEPDLPEHNLGLQIALYRREAVLSALAADSSAATRLVGIRSPILHLAFSRHHKRAPELRDDMLAIAKALVDAGADVNDGYPFEPDSEHLLSALYGALAHADNMVLARWLLEHGATPDDNESLYHATELGHLDGLHLLLEYKAKPTGTNALPRAIDFNNAEMVRLLLKAGANPDEAVLDHPSGEPIDTIPALHQTARRWASGEICALLLDHGADPRRVWHGHTPFATAQIFGNAPVAEALASMGHATPLDPTEEALAHCAKGKNYGQIDSGALTDEDKAILTQVVLQPGRLPHLKALVAAGFDPNVPDHMGMTPLHSAVWAGLSDYTEFFLSLAPDLRHVNAYGGDAFGTLIHGADNRLNTDERDHIGCADLLFAAGMRPKSEDLRMIGYAPLAEHLEDRMAELE